MTPFADTVCFVNCDSSELTLMMDLDKQIPEIVESTELWGYVKETRLRMATEEIILGLNAFRAESTTLDTGRRNAECSRSIDLVGHQCDKRRDNNSDASGDDCWQLIA